MSAGAEADRLRGNGRVRGTLVVRAFELPEINQEVLGGGLSGQWMQRHGGESMPIGNGLAKRVHARTTGARTGRVLPYG